MNDSSKFVLMILPVGRQGRIWQAILRSQMISVLWESIDVNLMENLTQLRQSGVNLPDLILLDTRLQMLNPYGFCRWSKKIFPAQKVVLINGMQTSITLSERAWAIQQGAADLLPRFDHEHLVSGGISQTRRLLDILGTPHLRQSSLVLSLLHFSRSTNLPKEQPTKEQPTKEQPTKEQPTTPLPMTVIPE